MNTPEIKIVLERNETIIEIPRHVSITVTIEDRRRDCCRELLEHLANRDSK